MGFGIPGIPGVPGSGGHRPHGSGGRRRKRKKKGGFLKELGSLIMWLLIAAALVLALDALPLVLGFDPLDAADFAEAPGLAKIDAFKAGWRHKQGISEMTFSHDGKSITFTDTNGTLTGVEAEGYGYDAADEMESDIEEARRIIAELGLD